MTYLGFVLVRRMYTREGHQLQSFFSHDFNEIAYPIRVSLPLCRILSAKL
jgi:hypothetical protein